MDEQVFCEGCKRYWTTKNCATGQHITACLHRGTEEAFLNAAMESQEGKLTEAAELILSAFCTCFFLPCAFPLAIGRDRAYT